jgi:hypothetical protein
VGQLVKPTPEFLARHDVDDPRIDGSSFRPGFRVRSRLDQLLLDRRIARGEWEAAIEFRNAWGHALRIGSLGAIRYGRTYGSGDPHKRALDVLDSIERLRTVELLIGDLASTLCFLCVVQDQAWATTARLSKRDPETIRDWTALAIRALAAAWGRTGRREGSSDEAHLVRKRGRRVAASRGRETA